MININNIKISLQALIKNTTHVELKDLLNEQLDFLKEIILSKSTDKEKIKALHNFLLNIQNELAHAKIRVSLNFALESTETAKNPFQIILNNIMERLEQQFPNDNLEIMFPSTTFIDNEKRLEFLQDFVQNHFQDDTELLERILCNMKSPLYLDAN